MDAISMNSENSKTSDPHRILLNLCDENVASSSLSIQYTWKNTESHTKR